MSKSEPSAGSSCWAIDSDTIDETIARLRPARAKVRFSICASHYLRTVCFPTRSQRTSACSIIPRLCDGAEGFSAPPDVLTGPPRFANAQARFGTNEEVARRGDLQRTVSAFRRD